MPTWLIWLLVLGLVVFATKGILTAVQRRHAGQRTRRRQDNHSADGSPVPMDYSAPYPARERQGGDGHGQDSPSSDSGSSDGGGDGGGGGD